MDDVLSLEQGDGVYSVGHLYHHNGVLLWPEHVKRIRTSLQGLNVTPVMQEERILYALSLLVDDTGWQTSRFRWFVPSAHPECAVVSLELYEEVSDDVRWKGVRCVTLPELRRERPEIKDIRWARQRDRAKLQLSDGIHTGLLLDREGNFLEGLDSNFFAIKDGVLCTAVEGVLHGLTMKVVLEIAPPILSVVTEPVNVRDLALLDEAFLTSTSRVVLPVTEMDGVLIGGGRPGPFTRQLYDAFQGWLSNNLTTLPPKKHK